MYVDCVRLFLVGNAAQLGDSARFVKRVSSTVDLNEREDEVGNAVAGGAKPLFLASVVGRRFPYRWIVMALSGFVCMAIIATLSVVYSNTW